MSTYPTTLTATALYRRMRREGYSRTYSRHITHGTTIHDCPSARCRTLHPHMHSA